MERIIDCTLDQLGSESDVEQKFVQPLLLSKLPLGLNYTVADFLSKPNIKALRLGKEPKAKSYFPDYVIILSGLPVLVIEAKGPGVDLKEAYKEARLYCGEINSEYPHKVNPCVKVVATNGQNTICGFYDSDIPEIEIEFDQINGATETFRQLAAFIAKDVMQVHANDILLKIRGNTFFQRPLNILGGPAIQNEELRENSFGSTLSLDFRHIFNPESTEERKNIVKNAYVRTRRHLKHVDPIDKIIKSTLPLSLSHIRQIEDTSTPIEVIRALQKRKFLKKKLLLLIGTVGSGKSTFTDYLREVAIDDELRQATVWVSFNLNLAPLNREDIYAWSKNQLIDGLKSAHRDIDFDDFYNLKKLFGVEFEQFRKTYEPILGKETSEYNKQLAQELSSLKGNIDTTANAFCRYLCSERNKLLIIVLDNCDKRVLEDQLLMFDVANWLKETYNCLVFLPLRDTTYNNFRKVPPLDTVINDFVFRIDPPLLKEVILERIRYTLREMDQTASKLSFNLSEGIKVTYPASDQGYYLASIAKSLFESSYFSRLISGLAGRDIREGLEIFLNFCKSGHLTTAEIFKMKQAKGDYILPSYLVIRTILRGSRRYYSDSTSYVKNIFSSSPDDIIPDPFIRLSILRWLNANFKKAGPTKNVGYHKISSLLNSLLPYGHDHERLQRELSFLITEKYIVTESQEIDNYGIEDLVTISPSGKVLVELLNDINYLASCAEDVYYREVQIATVIADRCSGKNGTSLYSHETIVQNAKSLIEYLSKYRDGFLIRKPNLFIEEKNIIDYTDLTKQEEIIQSHVAKNSAVLKQIEYPAGTNVEGEVISIQDYGVFIEFGLGSIGYLHISQLEKSNISIEDMEKGDPIMASVIRFNSKHQKFDLESPSLVTS